MFRLLSVCCLFCISYFVLSLGPWRVALASENGNQYKMEKKLLVKEAGGEVLNPILYGYKMEYKLGRQKWAG